MLVFLFGFRSQQGSSLINPDGKTITSRFNLPPGFVREKVEPNSFGEFLQNAPLKPVETFVRHYDGTEKPNKVAAAVLNYDVGNRDLQQCADAVIRLRAEYLYKTKKFDELHFNFTNGFNARYENWRAGYRILVKGNMVSWVKTAKESQSYASFREYLNMVFTYAGTASLAKELKQVALAQMEVGDVFIKGGSPGHAVIVVDMAVNPKTKEQIFMIAQSYMPAQDIHILINRYNTQISPWYRLDGKATGINTPEWIFETNQLKRF
ncbi:MAG: hypothetical protein K0R26_2359 [Bacteroidota bacterium]|nr:hypothetical protein [Bacteroidota bacterium]